VIPWLHFQPTFLCLDIKRPDPGGREKEREDLHSTTATEASILHFVAHDSVGR
jgi:hypothetical protein